MAGSYADVLFDRDAPIFAQSAVLRPGAGAAPADGWTQQSGYVCIRRFDVYPAE